MGLKVCGNYRSLVCPRAEELVALVTLDVEVQLVALDLGQRAADDHRAARRRGRQVPDVHLVADRGLPFGQQSVKSLMARRLHQPNHRGGRKGALAAHVAGDQVALDNPLQPRFEASVDAIRRRQHLDCR